MPNNQEMAQALLKPPELNPNSLDQMINGARPDTTGWPTDTDVAQSRAYDNTYGTPAAGFVEAGNSKIRGLPIRDALKLLNGREVPPIENIGALKTTNPEQADQIHRQWLAAQKSAVAALGFDPHHTVSSPQQDNVELTTRGSYFPRTDTMWYDRNSETSGVHEAIHRGIEKLKGSGAIDPSHAMNELLTRRLMMKHFGDVERTVDGDVVNKQMDQAKNVISDPTIDAMEKAAAQLYAKKGFKETVRGPR